MPFFPGGPCFAGLPQPIFRIWASLSEFVSSESLSFLLDPANEGKGADNKIRDARIEHEVAEKLEPCLNLSFLIPPHFS
jgi:hypothetical protein